MNEASKPPPANEPPSQGPTSFPGWPEVIVGASVLLAFLFILLVYLSAPFSWVNAPFERIGQVEYMKRIYWATEQMAQDENTRPGTPAAWPGDAEDLSHWVSNLVKGGYLSVDYLDLICAKPGYFLSGRKKRANRYAILIYAVSSNSPANTVFISSPTFTNTPTGGTLAKPVAPLAYNRFLVFRKDGSGGCFMPRNVGDTNLIGAYAPLCK